MPALEIHPGVDELSAFSLGQLDGDRLSVIETHVAGCPSCQARAARAADDRLVGLLQLVHSRAEQKGITVRECLDPTVDVPRSRLDAETAVNPTSRVPCDAETWQAAIPAALAHHERYRVLQLLGQGGMGAVYEAEHRLMQRHVALKVINPAFTANSTAVERFQREVRAAARLSHPNIVQAFDAENAGETHFLVMEYIPGTTLARLVKERGPLPVVEACAYIRQAASGLQHAHEQGMVHRDIKPENLILAMDGTVKLLDFGLASLSAETGPEGVTAEHAVMGTPDYMAPEQAEDARSADIRADVYSLGCTLYFLLTGRAPYSGTTPMRKILAHREQRLPSLRELPADLALVLRRMMAKQPHQRYQTPDDVAAALTPFTKPRVQKPRRGRAWTVAAGVLLATAMLFAGVVVHRIQTDKGELVITTESDDVEVIVKQGGKIVRVVDTKTDKSITLKSGVYELELKGGEGLKLDIDKATLTRGQTVLARIERVAKLKGPDGGQVRLLPWENRERGMSIRFSPDGRYCAAATDSQPLVGKAHGYRIWEVASGKLVSELPGFGGDMGTFLFTHDGKHLVASGGGNYTVWAVGTGTKVAAFRSPGQGDLLAVTPDGTLLACFVAGPDWNFGNSIQVINLETGTTMWKVDPLRVRSILVQGACFTDKGKQLLTLDVDRTTEKSTFRFFDLATGKVAHSVEVNLMMQGTFTLVKDESQVVASYTDPETSEWFVGYWNVKDGELVRKVKIPMNPATRKTVETVLLSDDGRLLSVNHPKFGTVRIFELARGTELLVNDKVPQPTFVRFSPDGRHAACDGSDGLYLFQLPDALPKAKP